MVDPFSLVVVDVPVSVNASNGEKKKFKQRLRLRLEETLGEKPPAPIFDTSPELYGRIYYFNHESKNPRDIHNIIKPLFDALEGYVYNDDKQIKDFKAVRLDMDRNDTYFVIELMLSRERLLREAYEKTLCFVEVGRLPSVTESAVSITWLE